LLLLWFVAEKSEYETDRLRPYIEQRIQGQCLDSSSDDGVNKYGNDVPLEFGG